MKLDNIDFILKRMIDLLHVGGDVEGWAVALEGVRVEFHNDNRYASSTLLSTYGGMGSLNDVVLYRDGQVLIAENNEFDALRAQLYDLVQS